MTVQDEEQLTRTLQDLWLRRGALSRLEQDALYRRVLAVLQPLNLPHYNTLRLHLPHTSRADLKFQLIADFYVDKVYLTEAAENAQPTPLHHLGALRRYYKNYLLDRIRRALTDQRMRTALRREMDLPLTGGLPEAGRPAPGGTDDAPPDLEIIQALVNERAHDDWDDAPPAAEPETVGSEDADADADADSEPDRDAPESRHEPASASSPPESDATWTARIRRAAHAWLDVVEREARTAGEPCWILLYLALHHCPEDGADRLPLSRLKTAHGIRDYHNKAKRLGITWTLGGFADPDAFAATLLGQWLRGLDIVIARDRLDEIRDALKILCRVALARMKADGAVPAAR